MNDLTLKTDANWQARVAHAFSRAAPRYDALATAQRHIGEKLWGSLLPRAFNVLDMGAAPVTGLSGWLNVTRMLV